MTEKTVKAPLKPRKTPPYRVFWCWDITYQCNFRCDYCVVDFNNIGRVLSPGKWGEIWDNICRHYGSTHIRFSGGEPFVYPDFIKVLKRIGRYHTLDVTTNLSFDTGHFLKELGNTVHDAHMAISASYHPQYIALEKFMEKLKILKKEGVIISATVVAWPPNFNILDKTINSMKEEDIYFTVIPLAGEFNGIKYPGGYSDKEKTILKKISGIDLSPETKKMHDFNLEEKNINSSPPLCRMGQNAGAISVNGDVYRCCARKEELYLGNIIDGTFKLMEEAAPCYYAEREKCACYKAMTAGKDDECIKVWHWPHHENGVYYGKEQ